MQTNDVYKRYNINANKRKNKAIIKPPERNIKIICLLVINNR